MHTLEGCLITSRRRCHPIVCPDCDWLFCLLQYTNTQSPTNIVLHEYLFSNVISRGVTKKSIQFFFATPQEKKTRIPLLNYFSFLVGRRFFLVFTGRGHRARHRCHRLRNVPFVDLVCVCTCSMCLHLSMCVSIGVGVHVYPCLFFWRLASVCSPYSDTGFRNGSGIAKKVLSFVCVARTLTLVSTKCDD